VTNMHIERKKVRMKIAIGNSIVFLIYI
jgi:hypothetical protein